MIRAEVTQQVIVNAYTTANPHISQIPFTQPIKLTSTADAFDRGEHPQGHSNSRLVENRSDTVGKEQLASLAFRSDSMLAVDGCSLVFLEGRVFN